MLQALKDIRNQPFALSEARIQRTAYQTVDNGLQLQKRHTSFRLINSCWSPAHLSWHFLFVISSRRGFSKKVGLYSRSKTFSFLTESRIHFEFDWTWNKIHTSSERSQYHGICERNSCICNPMHDKGNQRPYYVRTGKEKLFLTMKMVISYTVPRRKAVFWTQVNRSLSIDCLVSSQ